MASKNSGSGETEEDFYFLNIAKTNPLVIKDKALQERLALLQGRAEPRFKIDISKERSGEIFAEIRRYNRESAEKRETAANSAKRGRTEITSPPERPPTPGEAKLGDWMPKIEETITAQASKIKSLKATVEQLREALQANIDEVTEAIQISETKTYSSVSKLHENFDRQIQAAAESTDKKIDAKVEVVRADTVRSIVNQAKKVEEIRTSFDKQIREAVDQVVKEKLEVADRPKFKKSAVNGIFFTGLDVIAKREKWQKDITAVVHNILHKVGSAPYYTDVIAVHPRNSP